MTERSAHVTSPRPFAALTVVLIVSLGVRPGADAHAAPPRSAFDGARAHEHVRQLVAIGPRVAGRLAPNRRATTSPRR